jgi:hypothetical protein
MRVAEILEEGKINLHTTVASTFTTLAAITNLMDKKELEKVVGCDFEWDAGTNANLGVAVVQVATSDGLIYIFHIAKWGKPAARALGMRASGLGTWLSAFLDVRYREWRCTTTCSTSS